VTLGVKKTLDPGRVLDDAIAALNGPGADLPFDDVDAALNVAPYDPRLWHVKGLMHREREQRELAIPALKRAAELAAAEPLIAHGYARTLLEAGLPCVDAFARAMKLAPNNPDVVKGMVSALLAERRVADAIAGMELALQRSPHWVEGQVLLAGLRWAEGERDTFTRSFDRALAENPHSLDLWREQINALMHAEQWDEALARIQVGRATIGDNVVFGATEAIIHAELGHTKIADALFAPFVGVEAGPLQVRRVRHLLRSDRPEQANELIETWLYRPEGFMFWPYASVGWRMVGNDRWQWLEGDESFIGVYDIADRLPPLDRLAETLRQLHTLSGQPLEQSLRGGTQTDGNLFQRIDPILVQLREAIRTTVAEHVARFPPADQRHPLLGPKRDEIGFQGAWSVRLRSGGYHANHVHPAGWISSALYIALPSDTGVDEAGILTLGEATAPSFPINLPPFRTVEPKPGRLVLFPSYAWHGTRSFPEGERMTVAFDVARVHDSADKNLAGDGKLH
jgi:tetratricopeptide (TPR) repeat protein